MGNFTHPIYWFFAAFLVCLYFSAASTSASVRNRGEESRRHHPPHEHLGKKTSANKSDVFAGSGDWIFVYRPERVQLPHYIVENLQDGHGLAKDDGMNHYYFTFNGKQKNTTKVLVRYSFDDGTSDQPPPELLGDPLLSLGTPHGLRFEQDNQDNQKYLYHANNNQCVTKTSLPSGRIVWSTNFSDWKTTHPQYWPIRPTDAIVVPGTDRLLVADGYGSAWIHVLNKTTGAYLEGLSFGGRGSGPQELSFALPHSISLDHSSKEKMLFIVSDRNNQRLVWVTPDGHFVREQRTDVTGSPLPCNVDNSYVESGKRYAAIPSLGHDYGSLVGGSVSIYEFDNENNPVVVARVEVAKLLGTQGHQHPHSAIILSNGDLVVCCWSGPPNPGQGPAKGTISYWERLRRRDATGEVVAVSVGDAE